MQGRGNWALVYIIVVCVILSIILCWLSGWFNRIREFGAVFVVMGMAIGIYSDPPAFEIPWGCVYVVAIIATGATIGIVAAMARTFLGGD